MKISQFVVLMGRTELEIYSFITHRIVEIFFQCHFWASWNRSDMRIFWFFVESYRRIGETLKIKIWASVTSMSGECLHQFWSDSYRAPRNYDSDKGVAEQRCVKRNMHGLDTFRLCFDIFLDHKPAPPGVQHSYMSGKGQRFKSRPERPKKWWFHRFFHKNTRFFTFFSLQHLV